MFGLRRKLFKLGALWAAKALNRRTRRPKDQ